MQRMKTLITITKHTFTGEKYIDSVMVSSISLNIDKLIDMFTRYEIAIAVDIKETPIGFEVGPIESGLQNMASSDFKIFLIKMGFTDLIEQSKQVVFVDEYDN